MVLLANNSIIAWGVAEGAIPGAQNVPAALVAGTVGTVVSIIASSSFGLALLDNDTVVQWGLNYSGQLLIPSSIGFNLPLNI